MKATVNGVIVEGTPEEIAAFVKAREQRASLGERVVRDLPVRLGPRELTREEQQEHDRIVRLMAQVPNVNITPMGHICVGSMRFC